MILFRTNVYPDLPNIYFFGLKGCAENKTLFEKIYFFLPLLPIFLKKFGPPFHLGALGNCLIGLVEGLALEGTKFGSVQDVGPENGRKIFNV